MLVLNIIPGCLIYYSDQGRLSGGELDIPLPFSLISNDASNDELVIMPAYWFLHNMYALARNAWKHADRDKRLEKIQFLEYNYLAPDSAQELASGIEELQIIAARSWYKHLSQKSPTSETIPGDLLVDRTELIARENYCLMPTILLFIPFLFLQKDLKIVKDQFEYSSF